MIDLIILIINIIFFIKKLKIPKKNDKFFEIFRKVDYFPIKIFTKSYKEISNYLLNKFKIRNKQIELKNSENENNTTIKTIKLYHQNINQRWIDLLKKDLDGKIKIVIDKENPDYLIYATFGCEYYDEKYNNTIKIAFFTENQLPDLNYADYGVGLAHISYLDRFYTYPYFVFHINRENLCIQNFTIARENALKNPRTKFCGAVISNPEGMRIGFINELNKYKPIDMGGRYRNTVGGNVRNKIEFLSSYKFSIGMENSEGDGYLTEKIFDSFLAGTIPIYYGDYTIDEHINPKTYILIRDRNDINLKIEYIKKIDNDDELYKSILREKLFIDDNFKEKVDNTRKKFMLNIFEQHIEFAKRKDNYHFNFDSD